MSIRINRREFVMAGTAAGAAAFSQKAYAGRPIGAHSPYGGNSGIEEICVFSKHLQWLDFREMAVAAREIGFDGIDLTVRPGGHVDPERVVSDLPEAVRIIREEGMRVPMMTSAVNDPGRDLSIRVLETAAEQGIGYYRMGYYRYSSDEPVPEVLDRVKARMEGLARLNERLGIRGAYQNHAGNGYFGSPVWDLGWILNDIPSDWLGCQFDLRHASVESTLSWKTDLRMIMDRIHSLAVKDSRWETGDSGTAAAGYCPLGKGFVQFPVLLEMLSGSSFKGPVSMHFEYPIGGAEHGARELSIRPEQVKTAMKKDLATFKSLISCQRAILSRTAPP